MAVDKLEELRSALSCVYQKLDAETITQPDIAELAAHAEVLEDQIDTILDVIDAEPQEQPRQRPRPPQSPSADRLF